MKKKISILILIIGIFFFSSCTKQTGTILCTLSQTPREDIKLKSEYTITYNNNYVEKLKTVEKIEVKNKEDLTAYQESLKSIYDLYSNIDYYSNAITIEDNTLISSTVINYQKVDTNKLIEVDQNNASLIKDGKVSVKEIKEMYQQNGCNCKEK